MNKNSSKILTIITEPDKILRRVARPLDKNEIATSEIQELVLAMKETLKHSEDGVGLAAPQIGKSIRMFLVSEEALAIDRGERTSSGNEKMEQKKEWQSFVFINPEIKKVSSKKTDMVEGCLSVPGKFGIVSRPEKITVEWLNELGVKHSRGASKFFARVIQHETDHINGILFIDKVKRFIEIPKEKSKL